MKFLVDECLSPRFAELLRGAGHDAVHVAALDLLGEPDETIMATAKHLERVLISADTDFGELLAVGAHASPSVILIRGKVTAAEVRAGLVLSNLSSFADDVESGAIVVLTTERIRIRSLPIDG